MHSAIEQQPVPANLKIVRVRADLCAASEINEFQSALLLLLLLSLVLPLFREQVRSWFLANPRTDAADEPH
jgi:hypothetical protein